ncbi:hypothetical protein VULLAG_LOCUS2893 [Vulpes lagopus]
MAGRMTWEQRKSCSVLEQAAAFLGPDRITKQASGHREVALGRQTGVFPSLESTRPVAGYKATMWLRLDGSFKVLLWQCGPDHCSERLHLGWHQLLLGIYDKGEEKQNSSLYFGCSAGQRALAWSHTLLDSRLVPWAKHNFCFHFPLKWG